MKYAQQEYVEKPIEGLVHHPNNPRQGDVGAIHQSIEANGFYGAVIVQKSTQHVLAGNHRLEAARASGAKTLPVIEVDVDDPTALRIMLADNRTSDLASNDEEALAALLEELATDGGLEGSGYDGDDLDQLLSDLSYEPPAEEEEASGEDNGAGLEVLDVSMAEPKHKVKRGEVYRLGPHLLVCADVHYEWDAYVPFLVEGVAFSPYPTPMVPLSYTDGPLVMVQPDPYLAGHVLDKYASRHGDKAVVKEK